VSLEGYLPFAQQAVERPVGGRKPGGKETRDAIGIAADRLLLERLTCQENDMYQKPIERRAHTHDAEGGLQRRLELSTWISGNAISKKAVLSRVVVGILL
jgi:hypothetical protein